eukprot:scaffold116089_cov63-Phaeocystis_antarctica.AAC.3
MADGAPAVWYQRQLVARTRVEASAGVRGADDAWFRISIYRAFYIYLERSLTRGEHHTRSPSSSRSESCPKKCLCHPSPPSSPRTEAPTFLPRVQLEQPQNSHTCKRPPVNIQGTVRVPLA